MEINLNLFAGKVTASHPVDGIFPVYNKLQVLYKILHIL